jgi:hypothetical protein
VLRSTEELGDTPIMVLGNKVDLPTAVSEHELRFAMGLVDTTGKEGKAVEGVRPLELFMSSILRRFGYGRGASCSSRMCVGLASMKTTVMVTIAACVHAAPSLTQGSSGCRVSSPDAVQYSNTFVTFSRHCTKERWAFKRLEPCVIACATCVPQQQQFIAGVHGVLARVARFVVAWLTSVLTTLRLIARPHEVALLGLDNAGKTTLLQVLTGNRVSPTRAAGEWGSE